MPDRPATGAVFATTSWSLVISAGDQSSSEHEAALAELCRTYWAPVYAYLRRSGISPAESCDLTQGFFARFLAREYFGRVNQEKGRFRSYLLCSLKNFLADEKDRNLAQKRGGGKTISLDAQLSEDHYQALPSTQESPDRLFERKWALTLLDTVLSKVDKEFERSTKPELLEELKKKLWGGSEGVSVRELSTRFRVSESALHASIHRLRTRFRELMRQEISRMVATTAEVDDEIGFLIRVLSQ